MSPCHQGPGALHEAHRLRSEPHADQVGFALLALFADALGSAPPTREVAEVADRFAQACARDENTGR
ncbi:hypothetical protein ACIQCG_24125 [Streptomyces noursei]|uniref:hypothetical protein n=1 Tax=Streptomyces noursei TaxID=1971 RepID=UPI00380E1BD0